MNETKKLSFFVAETLEVPEVIELLDNIEDEAIDKTSLLCVNRTNSIFSFSIEKVIKSDTKHGDDALGLMSGFEVEIGDDIAFRDAKTASFANLYIEAIRILFLGHYIVCGTIGEDTVIAVFIPFRGMFISWTASGEDEEKQKGELATKGN